MASEACEERARLRADQTRDRAHGQAVAALKRGESPARVVPELRETYRKIDRIQNGWEDLTQ
jgi:hypothetical protein